MSMIPADLSAIHPATSMGRIRRLPRAIGWLSAAAVSAIAWSLVIEALRLAF
mgnify:CR=1 FL=1